MFTADTPSHKHSLRSKRTRQAVGNDDSVKLPLTKKRRSALRRDTFEPLTDVSLNEVAGRESSEKPEKTNGHVVEPKRSASQSRELTLRGAKKGEKRSERGGGLLTLSSNDFYTVAQLPSLPDDIRSRPTVPYTCVVSPEYDYILALTHTEALIWPYNSNSSVPSARDLISFRLPFPPATAGDPLPLAAFTARSANGEPGLVAVSPKWGKVVYWENITNASSFIPGQTTSGVQGSVPGLLSGEIIKELVNAEPAGFIITFNHGRVAHLTVRDQMGRPGIGVQFLRKAQTGSVRGGIFGSIRNVFIGDRRKGVPIVRAGKSTKAQRDVVVGTEDGDLEFWNTNLGVGNSLVKTVNLKEQLSSALNAEATLLDFELALSPGNTNAVTRRGDPDTIPMVALAVSDSQQYFVLELTVTGEDVSIKTVHRIKESFATTSDWRPRLAISKTRPVTFVLAETAVVLMSLAKIRESPSSQLLMEKAAIPEQFQDCIRFQDETIYRVLGYAVESLDGQAACVFAVQGFGVVRILSKLQDEEEIDVDEVESRVGPKSKIEQAIFFGTNRQNPLDLNKPANENFPNQEIEAAVLEISNEILSSDSKYLPKSAPSIENQMRLRSKAMEDLAHYALKFYPSAISRNTRFRLLWNAEKLAAAQAVWKVQESIQRTYPRKDDREMTYLNFTLRALHETRQKYPNADKGETDHVRHWLINSVGRIDHLMSELVSCLRELEDMDVRDPRIICDYLGEAVDLWIVTYKTAFKFREDNASIYGLGDEVYADGVLHAGYPQGLPHPWTSGPEPFRFGQRLIYNICQFLAEWWDYNPALNAKSKKAKKMPTDLEGNPYDAPSKEAMHDLADRLPQEVELFSRITNEENVQAVANIEANEPDSKKREQQIAEVKAEVRPRLVQAIQTISKFNMEGTIELAERLKDPGLLVALNTQYLINLEVDIIASQDPKDRERLERKKLQVQQHVETYFDRFGTGWAFAHFSHMVNSGNTGSVLAEAQANNGEKQKRFTWFLEYSEGLGQQVGKLSWINDVVGEQRFDRAQQTLDRIATQEETDIWAKKTELCLAKLSGLAAAEKAQSKSVVSTNSADVVRYDGALALLDIQDAVMLQVTTSVSDAIDEKAAHDLAVDIFGRYVIDKHAAFRKLLLSALDKVLANKTLSVVSLVDLLTLMDPVEFAGLPDEDPDILGHEFALALSSIDLAAASSSLSDIELDSLRKTVWRRAMVRDDWTILNETSGKSDREVVESMQMSSLFRTLLEIFQRREAEKAEGRDCEVKVFSPEDILATQSVLPETMTSKYVDALGFDVNSGEANKFLGQLEKDFNSEQEKLKKFVEKARLAEHFGGLVSEAERVVQEYTSHTNGVA